MTFSVNPLSPDFGAEITGLDLGAAPDDTVVQELNRLWLTYAILVFRDQDITPAQQMAFTRRLGEPEVHNLDQYVLPEQPEVLVLSNVMVNGRHIGAPKGGRHWHTDTHYLEKPSKGSLLLAREVPGEEGDTLFADMRAAYAALSDEMKQRIDGLDVLLSRVKAYPVSYPDREPMTAEQIAGLPDVTHPLVRTHPETGRPSLYMGGNVVWEVVGMDFDAGRQLLDELRTFCTQDCFVYRHHWHVGDAVLWDNRCTMHCATPFDEELYRRVMHRTTISGDRPFHRPLA